MPQLTQVTSDVISTNTISNLISTGFGYVNVATLQVQTVNSGVANNLTITTNNTTTLFASATTANAVGFGTTSPQSNSVTIARPIGGGTLALHSVTNPTGDQRLYLIGAGTDADPYKARISFSSENAWTSTSNTPTYMTFSTTPSGSASSAERIRITSSGNVGVGTTVPTARLDVSRGASDTVTKANATAAIGDLYTLGAGLLMQQTLSYPYGFVLQAADSTNVSTFPLLLNPNGGNVGIGTSSPTSIGAGYNSLTINGTNGGGLVVKTAGSDSFYLYQSPSGIAFQNVQATPIAFWTSNTERMRITSTGLVGIGTTGPDVALDVRGNQNSTFSIKARNDSSGSSAEAGLVLNGYGNSWLVACGSTAKNSNALTFSLDSSAPSEKMRLDSSGNLTIGAGVAQSGGLANSRLKIKQNANTNLYYGTHLESATNDTSLFTAFDGSTFQIVSTYGSTGSYVPITYWTGGSERMRIASDGNVGIGTTSTLGNSLLNVALGITARNQSTTTPFFQLYNANAGTDLKTWRFGNDNAGNVFLQTVNDAYTAATTRFVINPNGVLSLQGATTGAGGTGIAFPASQSASSDANCLDDYEEGTWTPGTVAGQITVTGTLTTGGNYTKIGRMVYLSGYLSATSISWSAGSVPINGLPFSAITSPQQPGVFINGPTNAGGFILPYNTTIYGVTSVTSPSVFFNVAYQV